MTVKKGIYGQTKYNNRIQCANHYLSAECLGKYPSINRHDRLYGLDFHWA